MGLSGVVEFGGCWDGGYFFWSLSTVCYGGSSLSPSRLLRLQRDGCHHPEWPALFHQPLPPQRGVPCRPCSRATSSARPALMCLSSKKKPATSRPPPHKCAAVEWAPTPSTSRLKRCQQSPPLPPKTLALSFWTC